MLWRRPIFVWVYLLLAIARADAQTRSTGVPATRLKEAQDLVAAGRLDAAEQAVHKILAAEPNRYDALVMLGELLEARGDLAGATSRMPDRSWPE